MQVMQSQQAWIMLSQLLSPLVQVTQTPISVASHLHMPIIRLQQQAIMPFIIMQHMQPLLMQVLMQSQQAWTIFMQLGSPLVQVMRQPMSVISILHMPIVPMLCIQQVIPLHI